MIRIFVLIIFFVLFVPIPVPMTDGTYNRISGWYVCETESACYHEIAHKLDDEAGWISHSIGFHDAIESYIGDVERGFLSRNMEEIYAGIFAKSNANPENMPELLRPYYDWERAAELIEKVTR